MRNVTGVNFYTKDQKSNELSQMLAHRRIKIIKQITRNTGGIGNSSIDGLKEQSPRGSIRNGASNYGSNLPSNRTMRARVQREASPGRDGLSTAEAYINTHRGGQRVNLFGYDQNSFPMIRDEPEERFAKFDKEMDVGLNNEVKNVKWVSIEEKTRKSASIPMGSSSYNPEAWANPVHMQRLEAYLEQESQQRVDLIQSLNKNMENISHELQSP